MVAYLCITKGVDDQETLFVIVFLLEPYSLSLSLSSKKDNTAFKYALSFLRSPFSVFLIPVLDFLFESKEQVYIYIYKI